MDDDDDDDDLHVDPIHVFTGSAQPRGYQGQIPHSAPKKWLHWNKQQSMDFPMLPSGNLT